MDRRGAGVVVAMCELTIDGLTDQERAELAKAMALLDPYLQIASVTWTEHKEPNA